LNTSLSPPSRQGEPLERPQVLLPIGAQAAVHPDVINRVGDDLTSNYDATAADSPVWFNHDRQRGFQVPPARQRGYRARIWDRGLGEPDEIPHDLAATNRGDCWSFRGDLVWVPRPLVRVRRHMNTKTIDRTHRTKIPATYDVTAIATATFAALSEGIDDFRSTSGRLARVVQPRPTTRFPSTSAAHDKPVAPRLESSGNPQCSSAASAQQLLAAWARCDSVSTPHARARRHMNWTKIEWTTRIVIHRRGRALGDDAPTWTMRTL
jgi:hypothetical protein